MAYEVPQLTLKQDSKNCIRNVMTGHILAEILAYSDEEYLQFRDMLPQRDRVQAASLFHMVSNRIPYLIEPEK